MGLIQIDLTDWMPEKAKQEIIDALVTFAADLAKKTLGDEVSQALKRLRSDASFQDAVDRGLQEATQRFLCDYGSQDQELADAIANDPGFWKVRGVRQALLSVIQQPLSDLASEKMVIAQSFASVLRKRVDRERVDRAVAFYLCYVAESLWHLEQLRPVYEMRMRKVSLEQITAITAMVNELSATRREDQDLKVAFLKALSDQQKLLDAIRQRLPPGPTEGEVRTGDTGESAGGTAAKGAEHPPIGIELGGEVRRFDRSVAHLRDLVTNGRYPEAVKHARTHRGALKGFDRQQELPFALAFAEFDVWSAHALMYTGETQEALQRLACVIRRLDVLRQPCTDHGLAIRWHTIAGRAHNHVGYINWMDLGHYEPALVEFRTAIQHSATVKVLAGGRLNNELATAYDNMGRVYAELGYRTRAELLIEHARQMREQLPDKGRRALSLISSALSHLSFGEPNRATLLSGMVLNSSERTSDRVLGLALLTKGRALRYLAAQAYLKADNPEANCESLSQAENCLFEAWEIFKNVQEWVRLFQVCNELGCVKRDRAQLLRQQGDEFGVAPEAEQAADFLEKSIQIAKGNDGVVKYPTHYADACVDLAEACLLMGNRQEAIEWIEQAEAVVPLEYRLGPDARPGSATPARPIESFWQQLGKISAFRGRAVPSQDLSQAMGHYTLAAAYFGRFLDRPLDPDNGNLYPAYRPQLMNHRIFIERLYNYLKDLRPDQWLEVKTKMNDLADHYQVARWWLDSFYCDTLGFLLDLQPADG